VIELNKRKQRLLIAYLVLLIPAVIVLYFSLDHYFETHFSYLNRAFFHTVSMFILTLVLLVVVWLFHVHVDEKKVLEFNDLIAQFSDRAIVIVNKRYEIIHINRLYEKITGFRRSQLLGQPITAQFPSIYRPTIDSSMFVEADKSVHVDRVLWSRTDHGIDRLHRITCYAIQRKNGRTGYYLLVGDAQNIESQMMLPFDDYRNRRMTERMLAMPESDRPIRDMVETGEPFSVIALFLMNIQLLEARFSQDEIQQALNGFLRNLRCLLEKKATIMAIENGPFFILSHHLEDAQKAIEAAAKTNAIRDELVSFQVKLGIARYPQDSTDPRLLMSYAHLALTSSKSAIGPFQPSYALLIEREIKIESALQKALDHQEFSLYYQPQIDALNHRVVGVEALLRWRSDELGNVSPGVFIPIAERYGYIAAIGVLVLRMIAKDIDTLAAIGQNPLISINTSTKQLLDSNWYRSIETMIEKKKTLASQLSFEIDEGALLTNIDQARSYIDALKELGVSLVIDNFGKGYSSFVELKRLPIDGLKIDRMFVMNYPKDDGKIVASLLALAKHLGVDAIVEGVENDMQKDFVIAHGARVIQGYYYARPMPLEDLIEFMLSFDRS